MKINHAILHVFDFVSCVNVYSTEELDLSSRNVKRYVTGHAKKALGNLDSKRGSFVDGSLFAGELHAYFRGERDFVGLSVQVAEYLAGELGRADKPASTDLLVVDFEDDPDSTVHKMTDEEAEAAYEARGHRYFAFMLLESRPAYLHEVGEGELGGTCVNIARHHAILPNPSQKVASFAVVDAKSLAVSFCDKPRAIAGEEKLLIPDGLLQCSIEASSKEVFDAVARIVEEVAEEHGRGAVEGEGVRERGCGRIRGAGPVGPRRRGVRRRALAAPLRGGACRAGHARARGRGEGRREARGEEPQDPHRHRHRGDVPGRAGREPRVHRVRERP